MSTKTIEDQLNYLTHEVSMLRSAVISVIGEKDPEGGYRPEFVSRILKLANKKQVGVKFTGADDFLNRIS